MTATDELRMMLDERGVEWSYQSDVWTYRTCWKDADGRPVCASQRCDGIGDLVLKRHVTPAQAIAATLGPGTCKLTPDDHHRVDKVTTSWGCVCSACRGFHQYTHGEGWAFCPSCGRAVER